MSTIMNFAIFPIDKGDRAPRKHDEGRWQGHEGGGGNAILWFATT